MRIPAILILTMLLVAPAVADVVILESNDVPLTGVILEETEDSIVFQLKGLGETSSLTIGKQRIKRYWREKNAQDFRDADRAHEEAVERVLQRRKEAPRPVEEPGSFDVPLGSGSSRSRSQVRADLIARAVNRLEVCIPTQLPLQGLSLVGCVLVLSLLVFIGGKVAEIPSLSIQKSVLLAAMAVVVVVAVVLILPHLSIPPGLIPAGILALTMVWLVAARLLGRGRFVKGMIMLSFVLATLFVAGSSLFGILAVV